MNTTRSQTRSTSASWCELSMIVAPRRLASRIRSRTIATPRGSVPDAGSSRNSRSGSFKRGLRHADALQHSPRVRLELLEERDGLEARAGRGGRDAFPGLARVAARQAPVERQELRAGQVPVEAQAFGHVAASRAHPEIVHAALGDADDSGIGPQESQQAGEQRRLSGAVGPDQAHRLSLPHFQADAVERSGSPAEAAVGLRHVLDGDHCGDHTGSRRAGRSAAGLFFGNMVYPSAIC